MTNGFKLEEGIWHADPSMDLIPMLPEKCPSELF